LPLRKNKVVKKTRKRETQVKKIYRCRMLNILVTEGRSNATALEVKYRKAETMACLEDVGVRNDRRNVCPRRKETRQAPGEEISTR
jgi:hypothetical protein